MVFSFSIIILNGVILYQIIHADFDGWFLLVILSMAFQRFGLLQICSQKLALLANYYCSRYTYSFVEIIRFIEIWKTDKIFILIIFLGLLHLLLKPNHIINIGACVFMMYFAKCSHSTCIQNRLTSFFHSPRLTNSRAISIFISGTSTSFEMVCDQLFVV